MAHMPKRWSLTELEDLLMPLVELLFYDSEANKILVIQ